MPNELSLIPHANVQNILKISGAPDILQSLADELAGFKPDVSTPKGRAEIASKAHKVAKSKMDIVRLANAATEEWRTATKAVVAERTDLERRMDELKDRVRQPLTDYENAEKSRVQEHEDAILAIRELSRFSGPPSSDEVKARLRELHGLPKRVWQEFQDRAFETICSTEEFLTGCEISALKREEEAAELIRLRAEAADSARREAARVQAEHEARIAAEAAELARVEAERKAAEEAAAVERKAREEREAAERAAAAEVARIEREAREAAEAAQHERDRIAAEAKAAEERAEAAERRVAEEKRQAEERERVAAEAAERRQREAVEAERKRQADEKAAEERAAAAREADKAHRSKIMTAAKEALMSEGLGIEVAVKVVKAIVAGKVPSVKMEF